MLRTVELGVGYMGVQQTSLFTLYMFKNFYFKSFNLKQIIDLRVKAKALKLLKEKPKFS